MIVKELLHQLEIAVNSVGIMLKQTPENLFEYRPASNKRSIRELYIHLALICEADFYISNGVSAEDMNYFYESNILETREEIAARLQSGFEFLSSNANKIKASDWDGISTSYWGVSYTRREWMIELLVHFYHHR